MESLSSFRKPDSHRTMGIEWEMFWDEEHPSYKNFDTYVGFFYVTTDGSLRRDNFNQVSRELVSQPLPFSWLLKELERVSKRIPPVEYNDSCGIHIHVSRKWATQKKVDHLVAFLKTLPEFVYYEAFGRYPNAYCKHMERWNKTSGRYYALNLTRKDTIEFRMFRSGDLAWAQYCVKLVNYMMTNALTLNLDAFLAFVDMEKP